MYLASRQTRQASGLRSPFDIILRQLGQRSSAEYFSILDFKLDNTAPKPVHSGMLVEPLHKSENIVWSHSKVTHDQRVQQTGHAGYVVWFTGLSGSGKSTLATELERELFARRKQAYVLDGDNIRHGLCSDLGFTPEDRKENIRRVGEVAKLFADAGIICITAFISPYRSDRDLARNIAPPGRFIEVFLNTPIEVCEQRDPKGLYAKARKGTIKEFTGISAPYEAPANPEVELHTGKHSVPECVEMILKRLGF